MSIDELKQVNLVELLTGSWNLTFAKQADGGYVALSPLRQETCPSFYVACTGDGHWVYCDHGDGSSGSIIDLMMRRLGTDRFAVARDAALELVRGSGLQPAPAPSAQAEGAHVDLNRLVRHLKTRQAQPAVEYLIGRGIDRAIVQRLVDEGSLLLNQLDAGRYCCIAVRDRQGELRALFNRKIDGQSERTHFLLGRQCPFCSDWNALDQAQSVYICEAVIDALSLLTLHPDAVVLAVPGAHYDLSRLLIPPAVAIVEAFDRDSPGRTAAKRLRKLRPPGSVSSYDLKGCRDVNELLCRRPDAKLSTEDRLAIALSSVPSRELARRYGVHHSRICDIRSEAQAILKEQWAARRPGRKAAPKRTDEQLTLESQHEQLQRQYELSLMRNDWLNLQIELIQDHATEAGHGELFQQLKKKSTILPQTHRHD